MYVYIYMHVWTERGSGYGIPLRSTSHCAIDTLHGEMAFQRSRRGKSFDAVQVWSTREEIKPNRRRFVEVILGADRSRRSEQKEKCFRAIEQTKLTETPHIKVSGNFERQLGTRPDLYFLPMQETLERRLVLADQPHNLSRCFFLAHYAKALQYTCVTLSVMTGPIQEFSAAEFDFWEMTGHIIHAMDSNYHPNSITNYDTWLYTMAPRVTRHLWTTKGESYAIFCSENMEQAQKKMLFFMTHGCLNHIGTVGSPSNFAAHYALMFDYKTFFARLFGLAKIQALKSSEYYKWTKAKFTWKLADLKMSAADFLEKVARDNDCDLRIHPAVRQEIELLEKHFTCHGFGQLTPDGTLMFDEDGLTLPAELNERFKLHQELMLKAKEDKKVEEEKEEKDNDEDEDDQDKPKKKGKRKRVGKKGKCME
jgi:hypothetical protein